MGKMTPLKTIAAKNRLEKDVQVVVSYQLYLPNETSVCVELLIKHSNVLGPLRAAERRLCGFYTHPDLIFIHRPTIVCIPTE